MYAIVVAALSSVTAADLIDRQMQDLVKGAVGKSHFCGASGRFCNSSQWNFRMRTSQADLQILPLNSFQATVCADVQMPSASQQAGVWLPQLHLASASVGFLI